MTKEQKKATIGALLEERRGYELRVLKAEEDENSEAEAAARDRVEQVNSELKRLGQGASKPSRRASKRPSQRARTKR